MVRLRTQNKITDFFMILAWASPFKGDCLCLPGQIILQYSSAGWDPFGPTYIEKQFKDPQKDLTPRQ